MYLIIQRESNVVAKHTFFTFVRALSISSGNTHAFNTEKKGVPLMNTHLLTLAGITKLAETRTSA